MFGEMIGKHKLEIDTPALLLDMNAVERNIRKMADFFLTNLASSGPTSRHISFH